MTYIEPTNMEAIASQLDPLYENYQVRVSNIANRMWKTTIKPWLDEKGFTFSEVNGEWWFDYEGNSYYSVGRMEVALIIDEDDQQGWLVVDILNTVPQGFGSSCLASFMPLQKYTPHPPDTRTAAQKAQDISNALEILGNILDEDPEEWED